MFELACLLPDYLDAVASGTLDKAKENRGFQEESVIDILENLELDFDFDQNLREADENLNPH